MEGKLLIFSAPSGSGKTTIVREILRESKGRFAFSISATTRPRRHNEVDGKDYYFLSPEDFRKKIEEGAFVEWEMVYEDCYYGTLRSEIERIWSEGMHVLFDVDVKGGLNIKKQFGDRALAIFVQAPSLEALEERLLQRGTDTLESIQMRMAKAEEEMRYAQQFDARIINENLAIALEQTRSLINLFCQ